MFQHTFLSLQTKYGNIICGYNDTATLVVWFNHRIISLMVEFTSYLRSNKIWIKNATKEFEHCEQVPTISYLHKGNSACLSTSLNRTIYFNHTTMRRL